MITDQRTRRWLGAVSVGYLALVVRLTLWPELADTDQLSALHTAVAWLAAHGLPVTVAGLEATANVLMFVPFGVLGTLLVSSRWWAVTAVAAVTSTGIETTQLLALPLRVATVQDVVLNTLGAAIGVLAGGWAVRRYRVRRGGDAADPRPDPAPEGRAALR